MLAVALIVAFAFQAPPKIDEATRKRNFEHWETCVNVKDGDNIERAIASCNELTRGGAWDFLDRPNRGLVLAKRGVLRVRQRQWQQAREDLNEAFPMVPNDRKTWVAVERGHVLNELERFREALADFNFVVGSEPASSDYYIRALIGRGIAYLLTGDYRRSIPDFDWLITNKKANAHVFYMRSLSRNQLDDFTGAEQDMAEAVPFSAPG